MNLTARINRDTRDVLVFDDGHQFGRLANCEVCHVFLSDDEELADQVEHRLEGDMSLREMLAVIRSAYTHLMESRAAEYAAECYAEGAWLRAAEYDPGAVAEMEREDAIYA